MWFAERCHSVTSFENDPDWIREVKACAPENVMIFSEPRTMKQSYDLLLIDGEPVEHRAGWILSAPMLVKRGGWVVLDNANRPEYAKERESLRLHGELVRAIDSNTSTSHRYLITEFWRLR